CVRELRAMDYW
nr:immunoglobulin heavy chain junction region [Mus musculus]